MRQHRFIDPNFDLTKSSLTITDREIINQWKNVLRLAVGDSLILGDGQGNEAEGVIEKLTGDLAEVAISESYRNQSEQAHQVTLYCAILKKENFELVVQKAVEVGVSNIVPITTDRTIKQNLRFDRLEKITKEAAEQSGRGIIPTISPIIDFKTSISEAVKNGSTFLFDRSGTGLTPTLSQGEGRIQNPPFWGGQGGAVAIFIGPEGGFTENEVALAKQSGAIISSLGPLTLRGETAAIVASYLAISGL